MTAQKSRRSIVCARALRSLSAIASLALAALCSAPALAQPISRPGDERPELPERTPDDAERILPTLPPLQPDERGRISAGLAVFVREFEISGSTLFSQAELAEAVEDFRGRELSSDDLAEVRRRLTLLYVERGYATSGALIPDQQVDDGVVEVRIREGRLEDIDVIGEKFYRASVLRGRLMRAIGVPLQVDELEEQLQRIQRDPRVERVQARLRPGSEPGLARLELRIEERTPLLGRYRFDNYRPPSIGGIGGAFRLSHLNLAGFGDELSGEFVKSDGLLDFRGRYEIPVGPLGTAVSLEGRHIDSKVVEFDFRAAEIENEFDELGIGVQHPFYLGSWRISGGLVGQWRRNRTSVLGSRFTFPGSGCIEGECQVAVLRAVTEAVYSSRSQALAARSTLSFGVEALGASSGAGEPDASFFAWLGQLQWARRLGVLDADLIVRADVQLSSDPLLTLEQFAVGGHRSVRGYRENQLVRDQGAVASLELRVPVFRTPTRSFYVELVPFVDAGHSWDHETRALDRSDSLASAGVGVRFGAYKALRIELFWGGQLIALDEAIATSGDIQDDGFQFGVTLEWP